MTITMFIVLILLATLGTAVSLASGVGVGRRLSGSTAGIITSAAASVMWGVVVVSAESITHYSGGEALEHSYPSIQYLAVGGLALAFVLLVQATIAELNIRSEVDRL